GRLPLSGPVGWRVAKDLPCRGAPEEASGGRWARPRVGVFRVGLPAGALRGLSRRGGLFGRPRGRLRPRRGTLPFRCSPRAAAARPRGGRLPLPRPQRLRGVLGNVLGALVLAQSLDRGVAQPAVSRPLCEAELCDESWGHPSRLAHPWSVVDGGRWHLVLPEQGQEAPTRGPVEPGPHLSSVDVPIALSSRDQERSDLR